MLNKESAFTFVCMITDIQCVYKSVCSFVNVFLCACPSVVLFILSSDVI